MAANITKSVRLTEQEVTLLAQIFESKMIPSRSESDLLHDAAVFGLLLFQAEIALGGATINHDPLALARLIRTKLLPVFEFLAHYDALPHWLRGSVPGVLSQQSASLTSVVSDTTSAPPEPTIAPEVKSMLKAFGTSFLDDD